MYSIGDVIMYPGTGVCKITDIVTQKFMRTEEKTYYVLKAMYDNADTTIYCPVDNANIKLRKLLDKDGVKKLIAGVKNEKRSWIENDTERKKVFSQILKDGDHEEIFRLVVEIHEMKTARESEGKKLHLADERALHDAEKVIHQELAYSMNLELSEVADFVMSELGIEKTAE